MSHTSFSKSLSSPSERLKKTRKDREAKIADASVENVGNGQMSLMSEANANDHNRTQTSHSLMILT